MNTKFKWLYDILFVLILLMAGYLRLGGIEWGEGYHQHPDELFMTGVLDNLRAKVCDDPTIPVDSCLPENRRWMSLGEYFNSATSTLNPFNRGYGFYVYGNLPLTVTRVLMEVTNNNTFGSSKFFARQMSASADLFAIFFLYLMVSRLYGRKVGVLAAAFSSLTVMQIQQSHFFTVDLFVNTFLFAALLFAVGILEWGRETGNQEQGTSDEENLVTNPVSLTPSPLSLITRIFKHPLTLLSIGFGFALGMAMASKINAAVMAIVLPLAFFLRWLIYNRHKKLDTNYWPQVLLFLVAGGLATIISFRIFQPYAFDGLMLSKEWISGISEQRLQATGKADLPWNLQWARRTHLYSFENLTVWGLGLPLGILAWSGFLLMGWRIIKGDYHHLMLWGWTALYFGWQSLQFNPTMRYQLPIYPLLAMMAAWVLFEIPKLFKLRNPALSMVEGTYSVIRNLTALIGATILALTAIWAFAFLSIYLRDETRMAASRWMFQNVPSAVNLSIEITDGKYNQPLAVLSDYPIVAGTPYILPFFPKNDGALTEVTFGFARDEAGVSAPVNLTLYSASQPDLPLGRASTMLNATQTADPRGVPLTFTFDKVIPLSKDESYTLEIETLGQVLFIEGSAVVNETDYDWGLPFRIDGYDPYGQNGLFKYDDPARQDDDLGLQVYWADDINKLNRYVDILSRADYIVVPTNHQYAQITRLPERYPLTTLYYRELIGCPASEEIIECYRLAQPGMYEGKLGFELAAVFESYPMLGPIVINDQRAEEAFTFYDHPKVLIFKKTDDFDANRLRAIFNTVDLSKVMPLTPTQFNDLKP